MYNVIFYEKTKDIETSEEVIERTWSDDTNYTDKIVTKTTTKTYRVPTKFVFDTATNCDNLLRDYDIIEDIQMSMPSLNSAVSMFEGSSLTSFSGENDTPANFGSLTIADKMFLNCKELTSIKIQAPSLINVNKFVEGCKKLESFSGNLSSLINAKNMFASIDSMTTFECNLDSLENGVNMFANSGLETFNSTLSALEIGDNMFANTKLNSFSSDMNSLVSADSMFLNVPVVSFSTSLPLLENGYQMFKGAGLTTFSCDLPNLLNGENMFKDSALKSFKGSLKKVKNAVGMFENTNLESFETDSLDSLEIADNMLGTPSIEIWNIDLPSLTSAKYMFNSLNVDDETIIYPALKEFHSDLNSLVEGEGMFRYCSSLEVFDAPLASLKSATNMFNDCKLNAESLMYIAETLPDRTSDEARIITIGINTTSNEVNNFIASTGLYKNYDELYERFYSKGWNLILNYNF